MYTYIYTSLAINRHDNQSAAGAVGAVEYMCNLLSSDYAPMVIEDANTLNILTSLADNARRAGLLQNDIRPCIYIYIYI